MSDIAFDCPSCQQHIEAPAAVAGKTVTCPNCKGPIKVAGVVQEVTARPVAQQAEVKTNVKQGALIGGFVCFALGAVILLLSRWMFFFYGPLFFVAFVLSIVAMAQRRVLGGVLLLLLTIILPPVLFFLPTIVVPSFMAARSRSMEMSCKNNLRLLDGAVQQYARDNSNAVATMTQLVGADAYIKDTPVCKGGGSYTLPSRLGEHAFCSIHGSDDSPLSINAANQPGLTAATSRPAPAPEAPMPAITSLRMGDSTVIDGIKITLNGARNGSVSTKDMFGKAREMKGKYLILDVTMENTTPGKIIHLQAVWKESKLTDNFDNVLEPQFDDTFSMDSIVGHVRSEDLRPGETVKDTMIFDVPVAAATTFTITASPGFWKSVGDGHINRLSDTSFKIAFKREDIKQP
jgi:hypothetical protein